MFASSTVAVLVTGVFVATGAYSLVRLRALGAGHGCGGSTVGETSHLLMSVGMIAMTWAWIGGPSSGGGLALIVVSGVFSVWFLARALVPVPGHSRWVEGFHVVMNAAMVWMVATMPLTMAGGDHVAASHGMSGMNGMGGMAGMSGDPMAAPAWSTVVGWAFIVAVLLSAALWAARAGRRETSTDLDAGCHVLMSLGMAGMLLVMV